MEKERLIERGWTDQEMKKAEGILEHITHRDIFLSKIVFWSALVVIIFANIIVSLVMVPFLVVLDNLFLYMIVILLGGTVGFLYNFLIMDMGYVKKNHHLIAMIIVPIIALANMLMMVFISNKLITDLKMDNVQHNPIKMAVVFVTAFVIPYIVDQLRKELRK